MEKHVRLTKEDCKTLETEKRMGYVFAALIVSLGALANLFYFFLTKSEYNYMLVFSLNFLVICLAYFTCYRINLSVNRDLKMNKKLLMKRDIVNKTIEKSYEVGSGALYIPGLGDLFPKLWGQKMRESDRFYFNTANYKYEVRKEIFEEFEIGDSFYVHFAENSATVLDVTRDDG